MHGSVVRGDLNNIKIGYFSSVQENCVIHAARYDSELEDVGRWHGCMHDGGLASERPPLLARPGRT